MKKKLKMVAIAYLFLLIPVLSEAQIIYTDIPDVTTTGWNVYNVNFGGTANYNFWVHPSANSDITVTSYNNNYVAGNSSGIFYPFAFNTNDLISSANNWQVQGYAILSDNGQGNWINVTDRYLAVKFDISGQYYYGWIRMDVNAVNNSFTVKDYAYNSVAGASILAGQMTTGIKQNQLEELSINLFPNPITNSAIVDFKNYPNECIQSKKVFYLYDILGNKIYQNNLEENSTGFILNRGTLPQGIYIYHLEIENKVLSRGKLELY